MTRTVPPCRGLTAARSAARSFRLHLALGLCALALLAPLLAAAAVPGHIRRHEVTSVERGHGGNGMAALRLHLRAFGRNFDLELEPSPLLSAHAETITVSGSGLGREPAAQVLFHGHLADDPDSAVRVAVTQSSLIGSVSTGGETWFFEPLRRYEPGAAADRTVVYRASDIDASALAPLGCAAEQTGGSPAASSAGLTATPRVHGASLGLVELTLVADYQFFAIHGSDSAAYMQVIVDQVAAFYPADLGVTVSVVQTVIHESPGIEPLSPSTDSLALLTSLAETRQTQAGTFGAGDITHLFTGRDLDSNIIGIAYVGAVCDRYYATSLVQDLNADLHILTLLTGHELGHALGAFHDGQDASPCETAGYGYVMWPSIQNALAEQFSTCSRASIEPVVDSAPCIGTAIPPDCGDGDLDTGEECDDGGNADSDCCRSDCHLDSAGVLCTDDGNDCTADVCDGSGSCLHPDLDASCDDADACTTNGQCSGGLCLSVGEPSPMLSARLKARFRAGSDDDSLLIRTQLGASLASPPTTGGATVRFLDETGALLHESVAAASLWSDRTGAGRIYGYGSGETPEAAGLASMIVRFNPSGATAKIRAKFSGRDLPFLAGRNSVGLQILVGDAALGDCGNALAMTCDVSATRLSCSL